MKNEEIHNLSINFIQQYYEKATSAVSGSFNTINFNIEKKETETKLVSINSELNTIKENLNIKNVEYHEFIASTNDNNEKINIWYLRLKMVCFVLLFTYHELKSIKKYKNEEMLPIGVGIYGSESISSDVDIGFFHLNNIYNYIDTGMQNKYISLKEVVEIFEQKFVSISGSSYTSLDLDIEAYASPFIDPQTTERSLGKPFSWIVNKNYCNENLRIKLNKYILAGMLRNIIQVFYDTDLNWDYRRKLKQSSNSILNKVVGKIVGGKIVRVDSIKQMKRLNSININYDKEKASQASETKSNVNSNLEKTRELLRTYIHSIRRLGDMPIPQISNDFPLATDFHTVSVNLSEKQNSIKLNEIIDKFIKETSSDLIIESIELLKVYLTLDYSQACKLYYEKLDKIDKIQIEIYQKQKKNTIPDISKIQEYIVLMSEALLYRVESYISVYTIIDIVYNLQAGKNYDIPYSGYITSAYEQIGYLLRFMLEYLINYNHDIREFYKSKKFGKKYGFRLFKVLENLRKKESQSNITIGGYRNKSKKNNKNNKKRRLSLRKQKRKSNRISKRKSRY